jgi:hypothetical protein
MRQSPCARRQVRHSDRNILVKGEPRKAGIGARARSFSVTIMNPDTRDTWASSLSPQDRIRDSLYKDTPNSRPVENRPSPIANVISRARRGGLHQKVRRRLGGSPSLDEPFLSKPKGMWWRTYEPLRETAERAEIRSPLLFSGLMARFPQRQSASMAVQQAARPAQAWTVSRARYGATNRLWNSRTAAAKCGNPALS